MREVFSKKTLTLFGRRGALQRDFKRVDQRGAPSWGAPVRGVCPFWCVCVQKNILNKKWLRGGAGGDHFSVSETEKRGKKRGKEGEKEEGKKEKKRGKRGFFLIGL